MTADQIRARLAALPADASAAQLRAELDRLAALYADRDADLAQTAGKLLAQINGYPVSFNVTAACQVIEASDCYRLTYSQLASAIPAIDGLVDAAAPRH
jgi:hypothetical protein